MASRPIPKGIGMHLVTQFGFDAAAICKWGRELSPQGVRLPVHIGMAGPAPITKLVKYAMACGVGASLRAALRSMQTVRHIAGFASRARRLPRRCIPRR